MKLRYKISIFLAVVLLILLGCGYFTVDRFFKSMCGNQIYQTHLSTDSRNKIVIFQRDCGATTGFSTQVSVLPVSETLENEAGNVFISNGHPKETSLKVLWKDSQNVSITFDPNKFEIFKQKVLLGETSITYNSNWICH